MRFLKTEYLFLVCMILINILMWILWWILILMKLMSNSFFNSFFFLITGLTFTWPVVRDLQTPSTDLSYCYIFTNIYFFWGPDQVTFLLSWLLFLFLPIFFKFQAPFLLVKVWISVSWKKNLITKVRPLWLNQYNLSIRGNSKIFYNTLWKYSNTSYFPTQFLSHKNQSI